MIARRQSGDRQDLGPSHEAFVHHITLAVDLDVDCQLGLDGRFSRGHRCSFVDGSCLYSLSCDSHETVTSTDRKGPLWPSEGIRDSRSAPSSQAGLSRTLTYRRKSSL